MTTQVSGLSRLPGCLTDTEITRDHPRLREVVTRSREIASDCLRALPPTLATAHARRMILTIDTITKQAEIVPRLREIVRDCGRLQRERVTRELHNTRYTHPHETCSNAAHPADSIARLREIVRRLSEIARDSGCRTKAHCTGVLRLTQANTCPLPMCVPVLRVGRWVLKLNVPAAVLQC